MEKISSQLKDYSILVQRLGIAAAFLGHGYLKLADVQSFMSFPAAAGTLLPEITAPVVAAMELLGRLAILLGSGTRMAPLLLIGVLVVAILTVTLAKRFIESYRFNSILPNLVLWFLVGGQRRTQQ